MTNEKVSGSNVTLLYVENSRDSQGRKLDKPTFDVRHIR